jgi:hypothetical protein
VPEEENVPAVTTPEERVKKLVKKQLVELIDAPRKKIVPLQSKVEQHLADYRDFGDDETAKEIISTYLQLMGAASSKMDELLGVLKSNDDPNQETLPIPEEEE